MSFFGAIMHGVMDNGATVTMHCRLAETAERDALLVMVSAPIPGTENRASLKFELSRTELTALVSPAVALEVGIRDALVEIQKAVAKVTAGKESEFLTPDTLEGDLVQAP